MRICQISLSNLGLQAVQVKKNPRLSFRCGNLFNEVTELTKFQLGADLKYYFGN